MKDLTKRWRKEAEKFRRFSDNGIATAFSTCADELEAAVSVWGDERVNKVDALCSLMANKTA